MAKRKRGRPAHPIIGPKELREIERLYVIDRLTMEEIGDKLGVTVQTIHRHIDEKLRPKWNAALEEDTKTDIARVAAIEEASWQKFRVSQNTADLKYAWEAIEHRAKLRGSYAPDKVLHGQMGTPRVAGVDREALSDEMAALAEQRLRERVATKRNRNGDS